MPFPLARSPVSESPRSGSSHARGRDLTGAKPNSCPKNWRRKPHCWSHGPRWHLSLCSRPPRNSIGSARPPKASPLIA